MSDYILAKIDEAIEVTGWAVALSEDPKECPGEVRDWILLAHRNLQEAQKALQAKTTERTINSEGLA